MVEIELLCKDVPHGHARVVRCLQVCLLGWLVSGWAARSGYWDGVRHLQRQVVVQGQAGRSLHRCAACLGRGASHWAICC